MHASKLPRAHARTHTLAADKDGNNKISLAEFKEWVLTREAQIGRDKVIRNIFDRMNTNKDNKVDTKEFKTALLEDPTSRDLVNALVETGYVCNSRVTFYL